MAVIMWVPFGIELKSEQHLEEMIDIYMYLHHYTSMLQQYQQQKMYLLMENLMRLLKTSFQKYCYIGQYIAIQLYLCVFMYICKHTDELQTFLNSFILPGGDQMTCVRVRGSQK